MSEQTRKRELGRGERVLPGVWRLRLPLPWPGVPHGNAWAVRSGDGIVLFDTGYYEPARPGESGSIAQLERALAMCALAIEDVRLVVCTHAHSDHYGQAATICERAGCELWMHPKYEHMSIGESDPQATLERRIEVARQSGVPEEPLRRFAEERKDHQSGIAAVIAPDRALVPGVEVLTDLGAWTVHETPGHAPSHVCLFQPERRLMISGDHLLGRISLFFDFGYSPDPVGEFLHSLDAVQRLGARLCLPGHGRTFTDVLAHIEGNRTLVDERLSRVLAAIEPEPLTAFEVVPRIYDEELATHAGPWLLSETLAMLTHLAASGRASRDGGEPERWSADQP
ncbi:MAG TPA: MBL fold metallo-hydrolase [Solirubrobacteraceae bacterium]|jgi:glyoxylase-like metal-dependent hydrolase (beta-lactamase superfamily II)|nr:MBL fold metallo-hydrolase [Solirubrobacteraceae bacterium]